MCCRTKPVKLDQAGTKPDFFQLGSTWWTEKPDTSIAGWWFRKNPSEKRLEFVNWDGKKTQDMEKSTMFQTANQIVINLQSRKNSAINLLGMSWFPSHFWWDWLWNDLLYHTALPSAAAVYRASCSSSTCKTCSWHGCWDYMMKDTDCMFRLSEDENYSSELLRWLLGEPCELLRVRVCAFVCGLGSAHLGRQDDLSCALLLHKKRLLDWWKPLELSKVSTESSAQVRYLVPDSDAGLSALLHRAWSTARLTRSSPIKCNPCGLGTSVASTWTLQNLYIIISMCMGMYTVSKIYIPVEYAGVLLQVLALHFFLPEAKHSSVSCHLHWSPQYHFSPSYEGPFLEHSDDMCSIWSLNLS